MSLKPAICTQCGGQIQVDDSKEAGICPNCGTAFITEKVINQFVTQNNFAGATINVQGGTDTENLYILARRARKDKDKTNALKYYSQLRERNPNDWEAEFYTAWYDDNSNFETALKTVLDLIKNNSQIENKLQIYTELVDNVVGSCEYSGDYWKNHKSIFFNIIYALKDVGATTNPLIIKISECLNNKGYGFFSSDLDFCLNLIKCLNKIDTCMNPEIVKMANKYLTFVKNHYLYIDLTEWVSTLESLNITELDPIIVSLIESQLRLKRDSISRKDRKLWEDYAHKFDPTFKAPGRSSKYYKEKSARIGQKIILAAVILTLAGMIIWFIIFNINQ